MEFMKIAAAFLVIVNHTNSASLYPALSTAWLASVVGFFFSKIAVPVFLLISGALLLRKRDTTKQWIMRIVRIVVVIIAFSAIYYFRANSAMLGAMSLPDFFKTIYTKNITNAFWYLYTYLGLLLMLPLFQKMALTFSRNEFRLLLIVSMGIMGIVPLLTNLFSLAPSSYFTISLLSPYIGLFFAGHYIEKYVRVDRRLCLGSCGLFLALIALQAAVSWFRYPQDPKAYALFDDRTTVLITTSAVCFYCICKYAFSAIRFPQWLLKAICYIGGLTFGVYLFSDLVISGTFSLGIKLLAGMPVMLGMFVWEIMIFIAAAIPTALLRAIPFLRRWL